MDAAIATTDGSPTNATTDGSAAATTPDASEAGSSSFNPTGIGAMLGGGADGGISFGVTPEVADGCDALCTKEATANCPNQGTESSCVLGCRALLNNPNCAMASTALFACVPTSTVSCDSTGKAALDACGTQTLEVAACFLSNATDPTLQTPCTTYCAGVAAAHCPNDDPSSCVESCQVVGGFVPACEPLWKDYVTCAEEDAGVFTCGAGGTASAPWCLVQAVSYLACAYGDVSTTTDAGGE
jgi:hypothetical protein